MGRKRTRETAGSGSIDRPFSKRRAQRTKARNQSIKSTKSRQESVDSRYATAAKCNSDIAALDSPPRGRSRARTLRSAATDRAISGLSSTSAFHDAKQSPHPGDKKPAAKAHQVSAKHRYSLRSLDEAAKKKQPMPQEGVRDDSSGYEASIESEADRAPRKEKNLQRRKIDRSKPQKELVCTNGCYDPRYYENITSDD